MFYPWFPRDHQPQNLHFWSSATCCSTERTTSSDRNTSGEGINIEFNHSLALHPSPSKQSQKFSRRYMQPFLMLPISNQIPKLPSFGSRRSPRLQVKRSSVCTGSLCDCALGPLYPHFWSSFLQWPFLLLFFSAFTMLKPSSSASTTSWRMPPGWSVSHYPFLWALQPPL